DISKNFGQFKAVDSASLLIGEGEFLSLVGPSGSGKTTLLSMIAGFERPSSGKLLFGKSEITSVPAHKRGIGMVFQKYALFPHLAAVDNIAFPLKMRGMSRVERQKRALRALEMVKLTGLGDRLPAQLSGGQQQRIALAR